MHLLLRPMREKMHINREYEQTKKQMYLKSKRTKWTWGWITILGVGCIYSCQNEFDLTSPSESTLVGGDFFAIAHNHSRVGYNPSC